MSDYLFDPTTPPEAEDREVQELEQKLARFKLREVAPLPQLERGLLLRLPFQLAAAALVLLAAGAAWWLHDRSERPGAREPAAVPTAIRTDFVLEEFAGDVCVDSSTPRANDASGLAAGDRIVCDSGGSARLRIGDIGWLSLEEKTRVRVVEGHGDAGREGAYRLDLERGTVEASIFAAPRVFALGTPSAIAVDLGCRYRTTVDDDGHTTLAVTSGRVSFESEGRKVHVPRGASCRAWPGFGPGTPAWEDASAELRGAVDRLDEARMRRDEAAERRAFAEVLAASSRRDSLTLWHLFDLPDTAQRGEVFDRLNGFAVCALPEVTRALCVAGDVAALDAWREELERDW